MPPALAAAAVPVGAALAGWLAWRLVFPMLNRIGARAGAGPRSMLRHARVPASVLLPLLALIAAVPASPLPPGLAAGLARWLGVALIAVLGWLGMALAHVPEDMFLARHRLTDKDNLAARAMETRITAIRHILTAVVAVAALGGALMTIPGAQRVGASLLASAGLAGLVAGIAATPVLSNLIAGLQLGLTQPIRLDDVVIVEGEWGRVEEITTTYVVVRIWDLRRLVVPLTYFIQQPFQNWTRRTANLMGTVYLYVDYSVPVDAVRQELQRILASTPLWDGQVGIVQVTDATERAVQLRALVSAADSGALWDLRCLVREGLLDFIRDRCPGGLPRSRLELGHTG